MAEPAVNARALSVYLGHSSITVTLDRYGHLLPGNELESVLLEDFLCSSAETERAGAGPVVDAGS